jgi:hypothetical protein
MNAVAIVIGIQVLSALLAITAIIYLAVKRAKKKKTEDFEQRDN